MAWETALDRLILQQIHRAEKGQERTQDVRQQILDLVGLDPKRPQSAFHLGYARHAQGRWAEALEAHVKAAESPAYRAKALYNAACAHALLGHADEAVEALTAAQAAGFLDLDLLKSDPDLESLRS